MIPPRIITIKSDGNVLTYQDVLSGKEIMYVYKYTKSKTKKGEKLYLTEAQLKKIITQND
jgi:hypothetical protein